MRIPHATLNPVRNVRSLFFRTVSKISCQVSISITSASRTHVVRAAAGSGGGRRERGGGERGRGERRLGRPVPLDTAVAEADDAAGPAATSRSCVTMRRVTPVALISRRTSITSSEVWESSAPVGSSARMTLGSR